MKRIALFLLFMAASAQAQWTGFSDASDTLGTAAFTFGSPVPSGEGSNENYYDGDLGDFDRDGLPDRVLGSRYGLLFNTGGAQMVNARRFVAFLLRGDPGAGGWGEDAAQWADLDGDGDLDGLMGGNGEPLVAQLNAEGRFSVGWMMSRSALNISNTDLERDGDVDLIVAHAFCATSTCGGPIQFSILHNDAGTFSEVSAARGLSFSSPHQITGAVSGDVDGDGDFDIVIGHGCNASGTGCEHWTSGNSLASQDVIVALNNGSGTFTQRTFRDAGMDRLIPPGSGFGQGMNLGDVDDDGDLDLVIGRGWQVYPGGHAVMSDVIAINDGRGYFQDESATRWITGGATGVLGGENAKLFDVDYDGDLDWVSFHKDNMAARMSLQVFLNDGAGRFTYDVAHSLSFSGPTTGLGSDVDIADLDGDGVYDVWMGVSGDRVHILLNNHTDPLGDVPRSVRVVPSASAITIGWRAPPFAATARYYRVYRASSPNLEDGDRMLVATVGQRHQDEAFAAPITRHTTTADLGDPNVAIDATGEIQFTDRTALAGVRYYYAVAHVGAENDESVESAEVSAMLAPIPGTDGTAPDIEILAPSIQAFGPYPRVVVHYADGQSGVDLSTLHVSFDRAIGGRAAGANLVDLAYRMDGGVAIIPLEIALPASMTATLTARAFDVAGNSTAETVRFFVSQNPSVLPSAMFSATPSSGDAPLTVRFDASPSSDGDGRVMRWEWYFGDGTTARGRVVDHTYRAGGTFDARLIVRDNQGGVGSARRTITVTGAPPPPDAGMDSGMTCAPDCAGRACGDDGCGGSCGACAADRVCAGGSCACAGSTIECAGVCVDPLIDEANCGACASACTAPDECLAGECGTGPCEPRCDPGSCGSDGCGGSCGDCAVGQVCTGGACACEGAGTACGAECVDVRSDARHCGACDMACEREESCISGMCVGTGMDAGPTMMDAGCGCRVNDSEASWAWLLALAIVGIRRRLSPSRSAGGGRGREPRSRS